MLSDDHCTGRTVHILTPDASVPDIFSFMFMPRNSRMRGLRNPYCGMLDA